MPQQQPSGIYIGRIFKIPVYLHYSWFIIFGLITFSFAEQFKSQHRAWNPAQYWILGAIISVFFFASIVFHELSHSVVAMHYKIPVDSITLFVFGGISRISQEASSAKQEFNIAVAGPLSSFVLGGIFLLISAFLTRGSLIYEACFWLGGINLLLGVFNLVPGFPMDGGRVLRAAVWGITKNYDKASRIAARSGQFIAYIMIVLGIWAVFEPNTAVGRVIGGVIGGVWIAFIGWFLLSAAQETYAQVAVRNTLEGLNAGDIMSPDVPTVARDISLHDYVQEVLRTGRRCHVVTGNGMAVGLVTLHRVQNFPRDEWDNTSVQAAMIPLNNIHWVTPTQPVMGVLEQMQAKDVNQMPVLQEGHIIGMISRDSILRVIQTRLRASRFAENKSR
ncbi:MAG TPA: site-2 protease family protein [Candidatus Acidoferrales bacterium]|nr:site-2 protease family protein [Candidatus Acidoferrales bacterium]